MMLLCILHPSSDKFLLVHACLSGIRRRYKGTDKGYPTLYCLLKTKGLRNGVEKSMVILVREKNDIQEDIRMGGYFRWMDVSGSGIPYFLYHLQRVLITDNWVWIPFFIEPHIQPEAQLYRYVSGDRMRYAFFSFLKVNKDSTRSICTIEPT